MQLQWERSGDFDRKASRMVQEIKDMNLPVILWGDATEGMWRPFFEAKNIRISAICDIVRGGIKGYHSYIQKK